MHAVRHFQLKETKITSRMIRGNKNTPVKSTGGGGSTGGGVTSTNTIGGGD